MALIVHDVEVRDTLDAENFSDDVASRVKEGILIRDGVGNAVDVHAK